MLFNCEGRTAAGAALLLSCRLPYGYQAGSGSEDIGLVAKNALFWIAKP